VVFPEYWPAGVYLFIDSDNNVQLLDSGVKVQVILEHFLNWTLPNSDRVALEFDNISQHLAHNYTQALRSSGLIKTDKDEKYTKFIPLLRLFDPTVHLDSSSFFYNEKTKK